MKLAIAMLLSAVTCCQAALDVERNFVFLLKDISEADAVALQEKIYREEDLKKKPNLYDINGQDNDQFFLTASMKDSQFQRVIKDNEAIDEKNSEPDQSVYGSSMSCPNVQSEPLSWGQKFLNILSGSQGINLGGFKHDASWGAGVDIFVVDSGVRCDHDDLVGRCSNGANFVETEPNIDNTGHGTHIAATAAGTVFGVAKSSNIISVKVLDIYNQGTVSDFIAGLDYVTSAVNNKVPRVPTVINLSLGTGSVSSTFDMAVQAAHNAGITIVMAAGNSGGDSCTYSPSSARVGISVAFVTTDDSGNYVPHDRSNHGECVDIYGPGMNIYSASPDCRDCYALKSGSSNAAPHVTGLAAAYLSKNPAATVAQVKSYILSNAITGVTNIPANTPDLLVHLPCTDTTDLTTSDDDYFPVQANCHEHHFRVARGKGTLSYPPATPANSIDYKNNEYRCMKIICPSEDDLTMTFTHFGLENNYDFLHYGVVGSMAKLTGTSLPAPITLQGTALLIFSSDSSKTDSGFSLNYECHSLNGINETHPPETSAPDTDAPDTHAPNTEAPSTPTPVASPSGTTKFKITTGSELFDGSVGTYDVLLTYLTGDTASYTVSTPMPGTEHIIEHVGGAGFPSVEFLKSITITAPDAETSNDDWVIASVSVWKTNVWWEQWTVFSAGTGGYVIDRDSITHPSSLKFELPVSHNIEVYVRTSTDQYADSPDARSLTLVYRNGEEQEVQSFTPHSKGLELTFSITTAKYHSSEVVALKFDASTSTNLWIFDLVKVNGVVWHATNELNGNSGQGTIISTITPTPLNTLNIRISTTNESIGSFPLTATIGSGTPVIIGYILEPSQGITTFTTNQAASPSNFLTMLRVSADGVLDPWVIEYLEVQLTDGSWSRFILADHGNVEGGVSLGYGGETALDFTLDGTPPSYHSVSLFMYTSSQQWGVTNQEIKFTIKKADGGSHVMGPVTFPAAGEVTLTSTICPFPASDVVSVEVQHLGSGDDWLYDYIALQTNTNKFVRADGNYGGWHGIGQTHVLTLPIPTPEPTPEPTPVPTPIPVTAEPTSAPDTAEPTSAPDTAEPTSAPDTEAPSGVEFEVVVTTVDVQYANSGHTYPVMLVFSNGDVETIGSIVAPQRGDVTTIKKTLDRNFYLVQSVRLEEQGSDGWKVQFVQIRNPDTASLVSLKCDGFFGQWIKDENGKRQRDWVGIPAGPTPPPTASVTFEVKVTTDSASYSQSSHTFPVELVFSDEVLVIGNVVSPSQGSTVTLTGNYVKYFSNLQSVRIKEQGSDGWKVKYIKVQNPATLSYATWRCNGATGQWIKDESGKRTRDWIPA
eukprot:TRINITY_DN22735_c0_g1_i1.p1 TRINITY_DN22735_c0_g1~~TRINITY_DN22735_c0_g1_i1.p1  ORF type:complete len:1328 (+),score=339.95 TRINITY_DN22735_c0_g1_i1:71-4054(+)